MAILIDTSLKNDKLGRRTKKQFSGKARQILKFSTTNALILELPIKYWQNHKSKYS